MQNALELMDQNQVWEALQVRYFNDWLRGEQEIWPSLILKINMVKELREEMRKIANSGELDNARSTGTE